MATTTKRENQTTLDAATRVYRVLREFRKLNPSATIGLAECFTLIILDEGQSMSDLAHHLDVSLPTVSRYCRDLSDRGNRPGGPGAGLGLIEVKNDREDIRSKYIYLTAKGRRVAETICEYVTQ